MTNIPYATGLAPTRWKSGVNVMLEKKKGDFRVNRLRTILLFEADFNQNNKLLVKEMMSHAESHKCLAPEQYGSRKRFTAIEHALNKRLTFDILRQQRLPAAWCANDAKSCYDRIVHSVASICMRRCGVQQEPVPSCFTVSRI